MTLPPHPPGMPHWTWAEMAAHNRANIARAMQQIQAINSNPALRSSLWGQRAVTLWTEQVEAWQAGLRAIRAAGHTVAPSVQGGITTMAGSSAGTAGGATTLAEGTAAAAGETGVAAAAEGAGVAATESGAGGGVSAGLGIGIAVTLGAVILIVIVGIILNRQQEDVLSRTRDLPPDAEPADIFIGPAAAGACIGEAMLEEGLVWTEQGWRAPLTLPEPMLYGDEGAGGDEDVYRANVAIWFGELTGRVDGALEEAQKRCGAAVSSGGCEETVSRATVWKPEEGSPDAFVIMASDGRLPASVWEWQAGGLDPGEPDKDVLVARLKGEPGTAVCVTYRFIDYDEAQATLEAAGVDEETRRWINTGCYWEIGVETEGGLRSFDADYANSIQGQIGTDGHIDLLFSEVACGIGLPAHTFLSLQVKTEGGATLEPR